MRMKNRFSKMGKSLLGAMCLLSTCGITYSCSDDYDLDEKSPSFLGESIYDELKKNPEFSTMIGLIDDVEEYKSVLSRTGSNTLFVADDAAFDRFFKSGQWTKPDGSLYTSYKELSPNQKKMLLKGSILNNAYVLETMSTLQGPIKNLCLRQLTSHVATDNIPYFQWQQLPYNQNKGQLGQDGLIANADKRFWDKYRNQAYGGMYLALDKTQPMLTHFLDDQLREKNITHEDVSFILGLDSKVDVNGQPKVWTNEDTRNRSFMYGSEVIKGDVTCMNGYYDVLDEVMVTPSNMAEVIRTNGETDLFSAMLDRFSAPYYDKELTMAYKSLNAISVDSIFQKRYIAQRSQSGMLTVDPDGESLGDYPALLFDPGWNAYSVANSTKEQDMAAMFVPSDEAMIEYFSGDNQGAMLIKRYSADWQNHDLLYNLYQIPLNILQPLINNLMKESFNESVPSKYGTIMNDAQDPMFTSSIGVNSIQDFKAYMKKVILANNGIVYVMNNVIAPADYSSVMAPLLFNKGVEVVNTVLHCDDKYTSSNYTEAPLRKFYSTYFRSMQSSFSFFVPKDDGFKKYGYPETMIFANNSPAYYRYWSFEPAEITNANAGKVIAVKSMAYNWRPNGVMDIDKATAFSEFISNPNDPVTNKYGQIKATLLAEIIDNHIVVHDNDDLQGVLSGRNYYIARSGAPIHVKSRPSTTNGVGMVVEGGLQIKMNQDKFPDNDQVSTVVDFHDMKPNASTYGNGKTYFLDRPMIPTMTTTYGVLNSTPEFSAFFELCDEASRYETLYEKLFRGKMKDTEWSNELQKYLIFTTKRYTKVDEKLVRFFNNYQYTVFVPSNEAIERAKMNGLVTLDQIERDVDNATDENGVIDPDVLEIAKAQVTLYMNFLKYHFCDHSIFVDDCTDSNECMTNCVDDNTGNYLKYTVDQTSNNLSIKVKNDSGKVTAVYSISGSTNLPYNLIARDYELPNSNPAECYSYSSQSHVVLHSLGDTYMTIPGLKPNALSSAYSTPAKAREFVKRYRILK